MKATDPLNYYPWYWRDYRANRKVHRMSYVERGLYRELLDECWVEGFIPMDFGKLSEICGCPEQVLADAWPNLSVCFEEIEPGVLISPRMHQERTAKDAERVKRAIAGAEGGKAKSRLEPKQVPVSRAEQSKAE